MAEKKFQWRVFLLLLAIFSLAIGCKPNGLPVAFFLFGWWFFTNQNIKSRISKLILVFASICLVLII
ncbi:hypothetical protein NNN71_24835, partial [Kluyvera sp. Awk 3]|nr:hypothetical protein [Kluyvera sp. Awk 3]